MAGKQAEPILDMVRGLSTVASSFIIFGQLRSVWVELYTGTCEWCRGAGKMTCPHCKGTKSMRKRPGLVDRETNSASDSPGDFMTCVYCGPPSQYDYEVELLDDEVEGRNILDNLKAAVLNKPRPNRLPCLAGTVPCPECLGSPIIKRHTPNLARFLRLEPTWTWYITRRLGGLRVNDRLEVVPRPKFLEYPRKPPGVEGGAKAIPLVEPEDEYEPEEGPGQQSQDGTMKATQQLRTEDFVINYIEDEEP